MATQIPELLARGIEAQGRFLVGLELDLTIYSKAVVLEEVKAAFNAYRQVCPADRLLSCKTERSDFWDQIDPNHPDTSLDRAAERLARRKKRFQAGLWDRNKVDSWSFQCQRLPLEPGQPELSFYRALLPAQTAPELLHKLATDLGGAIDYLSGHGGFCFVYDPFREGIAFSVIYRMAKRYLAIDVENLNLTIMGVREAIKGVNWLTLVGDPFLNNPRVQANLADLARTPSIAQTPVGPGMLLTAGDHPILGDRENPEPELDLYAQVSRALEPVQMKHHPDFSGTFFEQGDTMAWFRRFLIPSTW